MAEASIAATTNPVDLRRLHQFLTVATHLSFTRAAAELHVTQQALSSSVQQLERQLRAVLIDREGRKISLTPAGRLLFEEARPLLAAADMLAARVRNADTTAELLTVAHTPAITPEEVYDLIHPLRTTRPDVSITVRQMFTDDITAALLEGSVDVGLRRGILTPRNLAAAVIAYQPMRIAVSHEHRFATRKTLRVTDLADEQLIVWAPPGGSFYTDFLLSTCRRAGFEPRYVVNNIQGTPPVTAVVGNDNVAFVTAPAGPAVHRQVAVIDLVDPPLAPVQALWLRHTASATRDQLLAASMTGRDSTRWQ